MVMSGFRYAKHFDEPLKRKSVGYQPSCPPGLISQAKIYPARTILTFSGLAIAQSVIIIEPICNVTILLSL